MSNNVIGGEFEISPELLKKTDSQTNYFGSEYLFSSGRTSLFYILMNESADKVYVPDYVCPCVDETVKDAEKNIIKYHIKQNLIPEIPETDEKVIFLLVNHFAICDVDSTVEEIKLKMPNAVIVLDDVQALWDLKNEHKVDYAFSSFRKWLPVPDGSPVKTLKKLNVSDLVSNSFVVNKLIGSLLKYYRDYEEINDDNYLNFFEKGENEIDKSWNCKCSSISKNILNNIDYEYVKKRRRENFLYLYENIPTELFGGGTSVEYNLIKKESSVPMFFPLFIGNKKELRRELMRNNIFCPVHWPIENNKLAETELSLVIDQRYDLNDMDRIVNVIKEWYKCK